MSSLISGALKQKTNFTRNILLWFLLAILILGMLASATYRLFNEMVERNVWVSHTYEVIGLLDETFSDLKDVQSAQRGYAITGQETYLVPYDAALPQIAHNLVRLKGMMVDNPAQAERLVELENHINDRIARAKEVIEAYKTQGQQAAFAMILNGTGARSMAEVRQTMVLMQQEERALLAQRQEQSRHAAQALIWAGGSGLIGCVFILTFVFLMISREGRARQASESSLQNTLQEMHKITEETKLISRVGDYLQGCRTTKEAFTVISENMPQLLPGTQGAIGLLNNSHNLIEVAFSWGGTSASTLVDFLPEECWALRRGRTHLMTPQAASPACGHLLHTPPFVLCFPMMAHGETLGVMCITSETEQHFTETRIEAAQSVAEQTSLALANLKLQELLRTQSTQDALTGLYNRRYMEATLERETARTRRFKQPLSVIMFDVDHFKRFNDTYGHEAGDTLLAQLGRLLKNFSRTEDIACRYGGEEFLLIMPGANAENTMARAEALREACRELNVLHNGRPIGEITLSLGVASYPDHGENGPALVAAADAALYKAKHHGRNCVMLAGRDSVSA